MHNNRFECLKEESSMDSKQTSSNFRMEKRPIENTRFAGLKSIRRTKPIENSRFNSLKPVRK